MDPVSAAGLALGVASISLQIYTGCIQGIQLLITAKNFPEDCGYLNLRLRMEQQRLFAWSETSGLLDLDAKNQSKVLESNTFILHRQTVLDLLVQVQCLFREFENQQRRYDRLQTVTERDDVLERPEKDAAEARFPLPARRRDFIKKAMLSLRQTSKEAATRFRWVSFDKVAFETLLSRFATLNDSMTDILDARMQVEIHHTVQDTNRGVLQLHHKIADLGRLVMALNVKLEATVSTPVSPLSLVQKASNASALQLLSQLAKFKAFNESMESERKTPWDNATVMCLGLGNPGEEKDLMFDRSMVKLDPAGDTADSPRCEALLTLHTGAEKRVWVEWKEYERQKPGDPSPPKEVIIERVRKLAALLHHTPKPDAFRTPHCLGFFDKASPPTDGNAEEDALDFRLGLIFERPSDESLDASLPPVSLHELLVSERKPPVTQRVRLALAISNCLLYLHAVNWLHKGLRSHNIVFFRTTRGQVDYSKPYLSGFDFSRPARPEEMTDIPGDDAEYDLYRHPQAQSTNPGERPRFKKSFDIYSLGVLLVELAHWDTIDRVLKINLSVARTRPSIALRLKSNLLTTDMMAAIGAAMGEVYEKAARICISGGESLGLEDGDDETDGAVAAKLSVAFYENVVRELDSVRI
ncbi:Serine threonine protein kinase [Coniochaeta hoffmannii]|uniref:Serine threonine protein kinase n=1 Tax=Coniochaeta hoffmannii TaxID=91930 RepID=A0AA38R211_9PEZI|nr:Serine threonine protein kinase [Coniochaeta hoffmannii]